MKRRELLRKLAQRGTLEMEGLPLSEQADLHEAASFLLTGDEREQARLTAFTLRQAERHQLKFQELLSK